MTIDSANKRFSFMALGAPQTLPALPFPTASLDATERYLFEGVYSFLGAPPTLVTVMSSPIMPTFSGKMYPVKRSATLDTIRNIAISGRMVTLAQRSAPIWKYEIDFSKFRSGGAGVEWETMAGFYNTVMTRPGQLFQYPDVNDGAPLSGNFITAQQFGTGDGVTVDFQLVRSLPGDPLAFKEAVYMPVGVPTIFVNAVPTVLFTQSSMNPGLITFNSAPVAGATLTWTGNYNWLCRFSVDSADYENFAYTFHNLHQLKFDTVLL